MNRRVFLTNVATAGAAVGLGAPAVATAADVASTAGTPSTSAGVVASSTVSRHLSRQLFVDAMQARFSVGAGGATTLALVGVVDGPPARGLDQFAVHFRTVGASGPTLAAGIQTLSHPTLGELDLYLEPAADSPQGPGYRATLCLLA